ncbi:MAG: twin-arginine translocation signal domain-containing protein, partial [Planctomycetaceae bacterium]
MQGFSRRRFLGGTAAAVAAGLPLPSIKADESQLPASRMKFGLVTYLWGQHLALPELITACETSGLLGVEVRTQHKHGVEPSLSAADRKEVRQRFEDSPVTLVGYGSNAQYHEDDPEKLEANIELTKRYIQL